MIDLSDVTFMIPVKIDSEDRVINLNIVTAYLRENYKTNIFIAEQDSVSKIPDILSKTLYDTYIHYRVAGDFFHKARLINVMVKQSTTPFVVMHDSDVLFRPDQCVSAVSKLRNNSVDFIYPFNGRVINISKQYRPQILETLNYNFIKTKPTRGTAMGGCVMYHRNKFIQAGMMNENFISYGPEDGEQDLRLKKISYRTNRINKPLYHLDHVRTANSNESHKYSAKNWAEYKKIKKMNKHELRKYIETWPWIK